jgi:hypothetical protein
LVSQAAAQRAVAKVFAVPHLVRQLSSSSLQFTEQERGALSDSWSVGVAVDRAMKRDIMIVAGFIVKAWKYV